MERFIAAYMVLLPVLVATTVFILFLAYKNQRNLVWIGCAWCAILLATFFVIAFGFQWFPTTQGAICLGSGVCYCEGYQGGLINQPLAVVSDIAFIIAGLGVLYLASAKTKRIQNPMQDPYSFYPVLLGLSILSMGPASMMFHASIKNWGGILDNISIVVWLVFCLLYSNMRTHQWSALRFSIAFVGLLTITILINVYLAEQGTILLVIFALLCAMSEAQIMIGIVRKKYFKGIWRDWRMLAAIGIILTLGLIIWIPSGGLSAVWCHEESWLQPHTIWHFMGASFCFLSYPYFASEKRDSELSIGSQTNIIMIL